MPEPTAPTPKPGPPRRPQSGTSAPRTTAPAPAAAPTPATPTAPAPAATSKPRRQPAAKVSMKLADGSVVTGTPTEVAETISLMNAAASAQPTPTATPEPVPGTSTSPQDNVPLTQADVDARVAEALERLKKEPWHKRARSFTTATIASLLVNALLVGLIIGLFALAYYGLLGHPLGWRTITLAVIVFVAIKAWNRSNRNNERAKKADHERGE